MFLSEEACTSTTDETEEAGKAEEKTGTEDGHARLLCPCK
jgi:hypothetical protein